MRRIYDSRALERSEDDPFVPNAADESGSRTVDWAAFSHAFVPTAMRTRAISVTVSTDRDRYAPGDGVEIAVEFRNPLPVPIRLRTDSPNVWRWAVDGHDAASTIPRGVPERPRRSRSPAASASGSTDGGPSGSKSTTVSGRRSVPAPTPSRRGYPRRRGGPRTDGPDDDRNPVTHTDCCNNLPAKPQTGRGFGGNDLQ